MADKPFTLYGMLGSGPTYKVALMLTLADAPFAFEAINLREGAHKQPDYLAKNRFGQVPCLSHEGRFVAQSATILEYLADRLGVFAGRSVEEELRIREWLFWDFDRLAPGIYRSRAIKRGFLAGDDSLIDYFKGVGEAGLGVLEAHFAAHEWLVGRSPTIADIDVYGVVCFAEEAGFDLAERPALKAWKERFEALPRFGTMAEIVPAESRP